MASDRRQFERAMERWDELRETRAYSVPQHVGTTAIIASGYALKDTDEGRFEVAGFSHEAYAFADKIQATGQKTEVAVNATGEDLRAILRDPSICNVITIGHGALPYLYIENGLREGHGTPNDRFDWKDVSGSTDHLKTGYFLQRHCGNASRLLSVPLGAFALHDQSNVFAPTEQYFDPTGPDDEAENAKICQVSELTRLTYPYVKAAYSYERFLMGSVVEPD